VLLGGNSALHMPVKPCVDQQTTPLRQDLYNVALLDPTHLLYLELDSGSFGSPDPSTLHVEYLSRPTLLKRIQSLQ
jgi:hypothetical protein